MEELGKNEDNLQETSSAELSGSETASQSATPAQPADNQTEVDMQDTDVEETEITTPTHADAGPMADADDDMDAVASMDDDEDGVDASETPDSSDDDEDNTIYPSDVDNGLNRGDLIEGHIVETSPTAVHIDVGEDRVGIIPRRELELMPRRMLEELQEGSLVVVYVVNPHNHKGEIILSINQALEELDWQEAEEYLESKDAYDGKIGGYNKGGLIVRFGQLRGFVPQSQIADSRLRSMTGETPEERYGSMVNEKITVKVMEVDRQRNRLILSERAAMREVRQRRKEALIEELHVGEIREGRVVSLENFGAFVDVGGAEGLVHITEISWQHITHPRQVLKPGQRVKVKVISVNSDRNRIGLSIKQIQPDPWDEIAAEYGDGALVKATVTKLTKFGAFARLEAKPSVEGLIHISELSENRVEHPRDMVQKGDKLTLRVVKVDVKERRLGLSLKKVNSPEYLDRDMERAFREVALRETVAEDEAGELVDDDDTPLADVQAQAEDFADDVTETVQDAVDSVQETADDTLDDAADTVEDVQDTLEDTVDAAVEDVQDTLEDTVDAAVEDVQDTLDDAADTVEDVQDTVDDAVEDAMETAESFAETAQDAVQNAVDSVQDVAEPVIDAVQNAVSGDADEAGDDTPETEAPTEETQD